MDGKTYSTKVEVKMDPRITEPRGVASGKQVPQKLDVAPRVASAEEEAKLAKGPGILRRNSLDVVRDEAIEQEQFSLRLRDDVTKITQTVQDIRTIRKQLNLQQELLEKQAKAKAFLKQGRTWATSWTTWKQSYRIRRPRSATTSWPRRAEPSSIRGWGPLRPGGKRRRPADSGMKDLADEFEKELTAYEEEFAKLKTEDLAKLNELRGN